MLPRRRAARPRPDPIFAFLNIPFDQRFEALYLAFIAGLSGFGLIPQAALQIPGSRRRLDRLIDLLGTCQYSFHDLSRVELDSHSPKTPRFNMPFECGLAVGLADEALAPELNAVGVHRLAVLRTDDFRSNSIRGHDVATVGDRVRSLHQLP